MNLPWTSQQCRFFRQLVPVKEETMEFYDGQTVQMPPPPPPTSPWPQAGSWARFRPIFISVDISCGHPMPQTTTIWGWVLSNLWGWWNILGLENIVLFLNQGLLEGFGRKITSSHFEAAEGIRFGLWLTTRFRSTKPAWLRLVMFTRGTSRRGTKQSKWPENGVKNLMLAKIGWMNPDYVYPFWSFLILFDPANDEHVWLFQPHRHRFRAPSRNLCLC